MARNSFLPVFFQFFKIYHTRSKFTIKTDNANILLISQIVNLPKLIFILSNCRTMIHSVNTPPPPPPLFFFLKKNVNNSYEAYRFPRLDFFPPEILHYMVNLYLSTTARKMIKSLYSSLIKAGRSLPLCLMSHYSKNKAYWFIVPVLIPTRSKSSEINIFHILVS